MSDIKSLGYIQVQTNDIDRWRTFAFDVLGFAAGSGPDESAFYLRMDERAARIVVTPGDTDEVVTIGWEVRDRPALLRVSEALQAAGVGVKPLSQAEADARRVEAAITFADPTGATIEVFHGALLDHSPVVTPFGAQFVTGAQGLRHVVLPATNPGAAFDFYADVLGFVSRDARRAHAPPEYGPVRIRFLGVNERHHSLAICPTARGGAPGLFHIMVEVASLDRVGRALDRGAGDGFALASPGGRPTHAQRGSLYRRAPGGGDARWCADC